MRGAVTRVSSLIAAGLFLLAPAIATGQIVPQATPQATPGCAEFQVIRPPRDVAKPIALNYPKLRDCIEALRKAVIEPPTADVIARALSNERGALQPNEAAVVARAAAAASEEADPGASEEQKHLRLKKIYLSYTRLRLWVDCARRDPMDPGGKCRPAKPLAASERAELEDTFGQFAETLHLSLKGHGLTQPFAATLVTAFSFQNAGSAAETGAGVPATEESDQRNTSSAAGYVVFESVHFFARPERRFDVDVTGTLGFRPALTLLEPEEGATTGLLAQYQQAFVWTVAFEPNWRVADLAEVGGFVGVGETILSSTNALVENGANSQVAIATGADAGARFVEFGAKIGIYAETLDLLHLSKGLLSPMLGFSFGYRRDQRFESIVIPENLGNAQDRLFLRLSTSAIPLTDSARPDQPFTLTFALEHEWARKRGAGAVPHGTRVLIRGDLNLFKATNNK